MGAFEDLKKIWKKLGINGHVKNFSSKPLWVLETDSGLRVSVISKRAVPEKHFGDPVLYKEVKWGIPIQVISDVRRDKKKRFYD